MAELVTVILFLITQCNIPPDSVFPLTVLSECKLGVILWVATETSLLCES